MSTHAIAPVQGASSLGALMITNNLRLTTMANAFQVGWAWGICLLRKLPCPVMFDGNGVCA